MQNKITPARSDYECYWTYDRLIEKTIDSFDYKEMLRKETIMLMGYNGLYDAFGQACDRVKELEEENGRLKEEIEELRSRMTWRDISERPEQEGIEYIIKLTSRYPGGMHQYSTSLYYHDIGFTCRNDSDIVCWIPIPQLPDSEA